jgi:hypothetical protein
MLGVAKAEDASTPQINLGEEVIILSISARWELEK